MGQSVGECESAQQTTVMVELIVDSITVSARKYTISHKANEKGPFLITGSLKKILKETSTVIIRVTPLGLRKPYKVLKDGTYLTIERMRLFK